MVDNDDFRDELGKRGRQIAALREELWAARDRVDEAEARGGQLRDSISKLGVEVSIRRAKANGLEDQVAIREAESEDAVRTFRCFVATATGTIARMQQEIAEAEESSSRASMAAENELESVRNLEAEVVDTTVRLEGSQRQADRLQEQLAQQQQAEKELHEQLLATHERRAADQIDAARRVLAAISSEASDAKMRSTSLELEVAAEKERCNGLDTALLHVAEKGRLLFEETAAFERALRDLQGQEIENDLEKELDIQRRESQSLHHDLAETKRDGVMRTQAIQGALEETLRMLQDHLDETQFVPEDPMVGVLALSLEEAKVRSAEAAKTVQDAQKQCKDMEDDVALAQRALRAAEDEQETQGRARATALQKEVDAAKHMLEVYKCQQRQLREEAKRAQAESVDMEISLRNQEKVLRAKREELLRPLRWQASNSRGQNAA